MSSLRGSGGVEQADNLASEVKHVDELSEKTEGNEFIPEEWAMDEGSPRGKAGAENRYQAVVEKAVRRLNPRRGRRISPGCQLSILPENEASLRREIAYYQAHSPSVSPDIKKSSKVDIAEYWTALGVIPSAAHNSFGFRKSCSKSPQVHNPRSARPSLGP
jgi:hypothetical protein